MSLHQNLPEAARLQYLDAIGVSSWLPLGARVSTGGAIWQDAGQLPIQTSDANVGQAAALPTDTSPAPVTPPPQTTTEGSAGHNYAEQPTGSVQPDEPPPLGMSAGEAQEQATQVRNSLLADSENLGVAPASTKPVSSSATLDAQQSVVVPSQPIVEDRIAPVHLSFSWYSVGVLIINEVPLQDGAAMTSSLSHLQTAMVNALSLGDKQVMPQAQGEFHWPLVPGKHGDSSRAGAQDALRYQLQRMLREKSVSKVMLLGQRSADLLIDEPIKLGEVTDNAQWPEAKVLLSHSLHQLLKIPANKAEAWIHMQPLLAP